MSFKMPITKERIRNHLHYGFWMYVLLVVLAGFGWNLIYTTTRYRSPENLRVDVTIEAGMSDDTALQALMDRAHAEILPDMEEVVCNTTIFDETYGAMQLTVWVSAGQGDIYVLSKEWYDSLKQQGVLKDLQPLVDNGSLHADGIDLTNGLFTDAQTGETALCGIPTDSLTGLDAYGVTAKGKYLCVLYNNGNDDNVDKLVCWLVDALR